MNKEIMKIVNRVVSENISGRIVNVKKRIFEIKNVTCESCGGQMSEGECNECGSTDESTICESCGGQISEGECNECGSTYEGNINELGGVDGIHPKFGKMKFGRMTPEQIEKLLRGDEENDPSEFGFEDNDNKSNNDDENSDFNDEEELDENSYEVEEGNEFGFKLDKARKKGKKTFKVGGKTLPVKGSKVNEYFNETDDQDSNDNQNIQKMSKPEFAEYTKKKDREIYEIRKKLYGKQRRIDKNKNGKLDKEDFKILRSQKTDENNVYEVHLDESTNEKFIFNEYEILDIIENIVNEEKKKNKSIGAQNTFKSNLSRSKKENDNYIKSVSKKMKDYLKDMSKGSYESNPKSFPRGNYDLSDRKEKLKKYTPSLAVDEYIDAFSYPGMTNLVYDEIKPSDDRIKKYLKGDSTTGNAEIDKDGQPLGNVVPSKVGEKFYKNYTDNLYGQEQQKASYKRQSQPVDIAGEDTKKGGLKLNNKKKSSKDVLNAVDESVETKKIITETNKMKDLMSYNQKTQ